MFVEEHIKTPITAHPDVLVVGGGFGGICAAISAAREGKSVLLLERGFLLGGLATAGLVTIYLPLCDGYGRQVSFGLAEELLRLSVAKYPGVKRGYPNWIASADPDNRGEGHPRFEVDFNPQYFAIAAEQLLLSLGVKILYGTVAVAARREGRRITAVMAENKSGRFAIAPRTVVDATGDADIGALSGAPTALFGQGNVLAAWYYSCSREGGYRLHMLGASDIPEEEKKRRQAPKTLVARRFGGIDGDELSEMTALAHEVLLLDADQRRLADPTFEPVSMASIPQVRMTRRVAGVYTLSADEAHCFFEDSIGMVSDWRRRGPVFEVPYRTLYTPEVANLIFAGRCTSVTDAMWDVMRVIPCCAVTGEAAGLAAAMTEDMAALDVTALQQKLQARGIPLHEQELPPTPKK